MVTVGHAPLLTTPSGVMRILVVVPGMLLVQQLVTTGRSNDHVVPHCTDLLVEHCTCKQLQQPRTVTVWLQLVVLPQPSIIDQLSVIVTVGQVPLLTTPVGVTSTLVNVPADV
jgi:hypothetical protein